MTKQALRQEFLALRKVLFDDEVNARSQQICQHLFETELIKANATVHTFLPILRQKEVNTWPIIRHVWAQYPSVQVAVSITDSTTNSLTHYLLTSATILVENKWGIPEPAADSQSAINSQQVDLILVPLLVFDQQGQRVGYGGGYYDRFLAQCRPDCLKVGLSLFEPIERIIDTEPTDIRLDACITPAQIRHF